MIVTIEIPKIKSTQSRYLENQNRTIEIRGTKFAITQLEYGDQNWQSHS